MTDVETYLNRADANQQLLADMATWKSDKPEWYVTFAFYAALHYVKALGSQFDEYWTDHESLRRISTNTAFWTRFRPFKAKYDTLERSSRVGRYNPERRGELTQDEMDKAENAVTYIKTQVMKHLGRSA